MYCAQHPTGKTRLLHKKDGSYILQEEWYDDWKHKRYWEDKPIIEEDDLKNEKFVNEFEFLKYMMSKSYNEYLIKRVEELSDINMKDEFPEDFKMNNQSVIDFYGFLVDYRKEFDTIGFALFINDDGNIILQKTTNINSIYIQFKGNNKISYIIQCNNSNDRIKNDATIEKFWNEMNERNVMEEFEKVGEND